MTDGAEPAPHVVVSIVHWNGGPSTIACLESVRGDGYPRTSVVFVDNGSTDDVASTVRARWPEVVVISNTVNQGFTGGHNQGIGRALEMGADFVVLLNQDAALQPGCLGRMVALAATDARIGLVSPVIYYADDPTRVQFCGSWIDWSDVKTGGSRKPEVMREFERTSGGDVVLWGTALMIRRELIADIGLLDAHLFAYYEDTDYSVRSSSAGWSNRVCFDAGVLHEGHATRYTRGPHVFFLSSRNSLRFWKKAFASRGRWLHWRRKAVAGILHEAGTLQDVDLHEQAAACVDGLYAGWRGDSGPFDQRRLAPRWLHRLLLGHPYFWSQFVDGDFGSLFRRMRDGAR